MSAPVSASGNQLRLRRPVGPTDPAATAGPAARVLLPPRVGFAKRPPFEGSARLDRSQSRLRAHGRRERLRRAGEGRRTAAAGPRHHQSRHRPAGFQNAAAYRRGGGQGAARRRARLYRRDRHRALARGGGGGPQSPARRRGLARPRPDRAGRQGHDVHGDPDVRRAGRRHRLSRSRLPDLPLDDRVHRREAGPGADARGERLRLLGRGDAGADDAEDAARHPQFARQPDRRRHAAGRRSTSSSPASRAFRTRRSCPTRSTGSSPTTASPTARCSPIRRSATG